MHLLAVCLLAVAATQAYGSSLTLSQCVQAKNGYTWWAGLIQKKCKWSPQKSEIVLTKCKTPNKGVQLNAGEDARDGNFHYECEGDEDSLELDIEHCYLSDNGPALQIGDTAVVGAKRFYCEEIDGKVKFGWTEESAGCTYKGKKYNLNAWFNDVAVQQRLRCKKVGTKLEMQIAGCVFPDGKTLANFWQSKNGKFCKSTNGGKGAELEDAAQCTAKDGSKKNLYSTWLEEGIQVRCDAKNLNDYKSGKAAVLITYIRFWQCYQKIANSNFYRRPNSAAKAKDGKYYACRLGTGLNHLGTAMWELRLLSGGGSGGAEDFQCEVQGEKFEIDTWKILNNVRYRCYYNQKAKYYIRDCQSDDKKYHSKNKVVNYNTYAMKCEQTNGKVVWRRLTDSEFSIWKASKGGSITAGGASDSGVEGTVTSCDEGYEIVEDDGVRQCKDINECVKGGHDCTGKERCHNTKGSFTCLCKSGFVRFIETDECGEVECPCTGENPIPQPTVAIAGAPLL